MIDASEFDRAIRDGNISPIGADGLVDGARSPLDQVPDRRVLGSALDGALGSAFWVVHFG